MAAGSNGVSTWGTGVNEGTELASNFQSVFAPGGAVIVDLGSLIAMG
jgi:hypothetical protein